MASKYSLLALGIGVYLAVAIVSFPAAVAERWFAPDGVRLAAVGGTIWRGEAAYGAVNGLTFSNLEWRLKPLALLTGRLNLTAETDLAAGFARSDVSVSGNELTLTNVSASTDLQTFRDLLDLGEVRGQVGLTLDRLELVDGWPVSAAGEARVGNLSVPPLVAMSGITTIPLGNYLLQFAPTDGQGIVALVNDQGGPLELSGRINLAVDRSYLIDTVLKERADAAPVLVQGLDLLAPAGSDGQRNFQWMGAL